MRVNCRGPRGPKVTLLSGLTSWVESGILISWQGVKCACGGPKCIPFSSLLSFEEVFKMTALAIKKLSWNGLSDRNKRIMRFTPVGDVLELGVPARFLDGGGVVEWFVFDDHRFKVVPMAYFGCLAANLADIPSGYVVPEIELLDEEGLGTGVFVLNRVKLRSDIKSFCEDPARTNPLVLPKDVVFPENDPNPWQTLLNAQGVSGNIKMASGVPESWKAVEVSGP